MGRKLWIPLVIKNVLVFGGIWAVTATSVALVRYPSLTGEHLADEEVETLDLEEFVPKGGNIPFAHKYPSYFAAATEVNKKFWEDRFNERKGEGNKIKNDDPSNSKLDIVSALDAPEGPQEGKLSLVSFCRNGYSTTSSFDSENKEWGFSSSAENKEDQGHLKVWSLCSVFGSRPETLIKRDNEDEDWTSIYTEGQLGKSAPYSLVKSDNQDAFWAIREQEWQVTNVGDSTYFGNDKKDNNSIKDLCKGAYDKDTTETDSDSTPSKTTITKYCGLEWTWD